MSETRVARKERTRRAILDAALDLCEGSSLVALSLRQVAKEVGIVPTAFYRHFESIEELGLALVDESFATLRAMLRDVRQGPPSLDSIIDTSIDIVAQHVQEHRQHFAFILRERYAGPPAVRAEVARQIELFERELAADVAQLPGVDQWSDDDVRAVSNLIVNALVTAAQGFIETPDRPDVEKLLVETARTQLRMVLIGALNWRSRG